MKKPRMKNLSLLSLQAEGFNFSVRPSWWCTCGSSSGGSIRKRLSSSGGQAGQGDRAQYLRKIFWRSTRTRWIEYRICGSSSCLTTRRRWWCKVLLAAEFSTCGRCSDGPTRTRWRGKVHRKFFLRAKQDTMTGFSTCEILLLASPGQGSSSKNVYCVFVRVTSLFNTDILYH